MIYMTLITKGVLTCQALHDFYNEIRYSHAFNGLKLNFQAQNGSFIISDNQFFILFDSSDCPNKACAYDVMTCREGVFPVF